MSLKRINALRSTVLLAGASSLVLAGCALKNPPFGADIMPESDSREDPGKLGRPASQRHRRAELDPQFRRPGA